VAKDDDWQLYCNYTQPRALLERFGGHWPATELDGPARALMRALAPRPVSTWGLREKVRLPQRQLGRTLERLQAMRLVRRTRDRVMLDFPLLTAESLSNEEKEAVSTLVDRALRLLIPPLWELASELVELRPGASWAEWGWALLAPILGNLWAESAGLRDVAFGVGRELPHLRYRLVPCSPQIAVGYPEGHRFPMARELGMLFAQPAVRQSLGTAEADGRLMVQESSRASLAEAGMLRGSRTAHEMDYRLTVPLLEPGLFQPLEGVLRALCGALARALRETEPVLRAAYRRGSFAHLEDAGTRDWVAAILTVAAGLLADRLVEEELLAAPVRRKITVRDAGEEAGSGVVLQ